MNGFFLVLVALVAAYRDIGVDVALCGELYLNVGIVDTALAALEWSLDYLGIVCAVPI